MKLSFAIRDLLILTTISSLVFMACWYVPDEGSKTGKITNEGQNFPITIPWDDGSIDSTRDGVIESTSAPNVWTFTYRRRPTLSEFAKRAAICHVILIVSCAVLKAILEQPARSSLE